MGTDRPQKKKGDETMNELKTDKKIVIHVSVWLTILSCFLLLGAKVWRRAEVLNLRNASDSLILLIEFKTEPGMDYIQAKADYAEMLHKYIRHMESRGDSFLIRLPPFSKNNIVKVLEWAAEDLEEGLSSEKETDQQKEARKKIEAASEAIARFFNKSKLFIDEPIITFEVKPFSEEIRTAIKESLEEAHKKADMYEDDTNMANFEAVYQANRKAIVYLYLVRCGWQGIVSQEEIRRFRADIDRCIYYNRVLQRSPVVKNGEGTKGSSHWLLGEYLNSEIRRLRILQCIIDNEIQ